MTSVCEVVFCFDFFPNSCFSVHLVKRSKVSLTKIVSSYAGTLSGNST